MTATMIMAAPTSRMPTWPRDAVKKPFRIAHRRHQSAPGRMAVRMNVIASAILAERGIRLAMRAVSVA
jgi:hypothetical protein